MSINVIDIDLPYNYAQSHACRLIVESCASKADLGMTSSHFRVSSITEQLARLPEGATYHHVQINSPQRQKRNQRIFSYPGQDRDGQSGVWALTRTSSSDFTEIMEMLDKRMNDKGKNWRHVLKALKVLDYCLHEGSEMVVTWARKNIYIVRTLREFQYVDEDGRDVGQNSKSKALDHDKL
ncbi:hypothetical protein MRB53_037586 [Persea americana]|nr:hypothetical protein MRB53_037586 [Persea americana]